MKGIRETAVMLKYALVLSGLALFTCMPAFGSVRYEQGKAWDPRKTRVLYTESHWTRFAGSVPVHRTVLYQCADGTPFARKEIRYSPSVLAPAFSFRDARHDYQEGLNWADGKASLWYSEAGVRKSKPLPAAPNLVADAGFDEFIRARWSASRRGSRSESTSLGPRRCRDSSTASCWRSSSSSSASG